ncbi:acyl-CoA dehydrogenase family protein [bacterium]|jgi:alkylation response protein AidB-like acyl-CoA dehydrogenase|nr:acyl-CoA dehydrogenase family protein [bacterium]
MNAPLTMEASPRTETSEEILRDVENFCEQIRPSEELCYLEHRFNDETIRLGKEHNLLGLLVPREYGGRGADLRTYAKSLVRIGREGSGVRTLFSGHCSIGQLPIIAFGNEQQKKKYLPPAARGESIMAFGLTEPEAGSNPLEMQTTYRREGNHYILNGVKYLISNGGIADVVVTFAYPEGQQGRVSAFIVPTDGEGFEKEDLTAKMGLPTSNTAMFEMRDYPVPVENMLAAEGDGFRVAMTTLVSGRLSVAAGCLGVIEDCLIESISYAKERRQHGKEIGRHQLVQEHLAMIEIHRQASESILFSAVDAKITSDANPNDKELKRKADLLSAEAKFFTSNAAWDAADRAVQIYGGRGYSTLYRPARHLTDVRVCRIYEGTDEILKLKIAASLLGKDWEAFK